MDFRNREMRKLVIKVVDKMILPNGVSGFYDSEFNKPPRVNGYQFKQLCFDFASKNGGKMLAFNHPHYPRNFYISQFDILGKHLYVLLNEHYPFVAFASFVDIENIKFIDNPQLVENFSDYYTVLGKEQLNVPFNKSVIEKSEFNGAELKQFAFWKPNTVGEIIFNYWD